MTILQCQYTCAVSQNTISTIAESNISNRAQDQDLLTQLPQQLLQALKPRKSSSFWNTIHIFPPNISQFKDMNRCVINWLWRNNRRSQNNSGFWNQSEKNLHINVFELTDNSIHYHQKFQAFQHIYLLLETDETTRFAINKWRSPSKHILNVLTTLQKLCLQRNSHKSISNTNSPQCDRGFIKHGRSHTLKNVPESNDFHLCNVGLTNSK